MSTTAVEQRLQQIWETPKTIHGWFATVDHKEIGHRYLATAFIFLIIGGVEALIMRIQLARSDQSWLTPEAYNQLFTMHGMTMIFWYAAPILSGFANYLIPLMIGARDMAFPRLNAFSYWTFRAFGHSALHQRVSGTVAARRLVCLCPVYQSSLFARLWHGLLRSCTDFPDNFYNRRSDQFHRVDLSFARPWHDDQPHASFSVQHADHLVRDSDVAACADRRLRVPRDWIDVGARISSIRVLAATPIVAAVVLVFWASLGLRGVSSRHRHGFDDHSGLLAAADRRLSLCCDFDRPDWRGRFWCLAAPHVRGGNV